MSYSFSLKSLSNTKLDAMLTQYGASTFGSTERKRERLQRFLDAQVDQDLAASRRRIARDAETGEPAPKQRRIEPEPVRRSARLAAQQSNVCPSPSSAPAQSPVRRPAPPSLPGTQHSMVTRSMARAAAETPRPRRNSPAPSPARRSHVMVTRSQDTNQRSAARAALQRIHEILAAYLA
jgi:hypothetical protein